MFSTVNALPADLILKISAAYRADPRPDKIDLGVGVYRDDGGLTPIMSAVKKAEKALLHDQTTKVYIPPSGVPGFGEAITALTLGDGHTALRDNRVQCLQVPGGCGALRVGAELIKVANPDATIWVSDPTWDIHEPLLTANGLKLKTYPYYDKQRGNLLFDDMINVLRKVPSKDVVVLHGSCHNPTGEDLSPDQWRVLSDLAVTNGFMPFIDMAYQGFAQNPDDDAFGARLMASDNPAVLIANSCSKTFNLYRERTGALLLIGQSTSEADALLTQSLFFARCMYSMPPAHGADIVTRILSDEVLKNEWSAELAQMRERIKLLRTLLAQQLAEHLNTNKYDYIALQNGLFSLLDISPTQVDAMRDEQGVYIVGSGRINIAGLTEEKIRSLVKAIGAVVQP